MTAAIRGIEQVNATLSKLPKEVRARIASRELRKALQLIHREAQQMLAKGTTPKRGTLAQSFKVRTKVSKTGRRAGILAGEVANTAPHAHFIEKGHALVKNDKKIGHVAARPFLQPAAITEADNVFELMAAGVLAALQKHEKKAGQ